MRKTLRHDYQIAVGTAVVTLQATSHGNACRRMFRRLIKMDDYVSRQPQSTSDGGWETTDVETWTEQRVSRLQRAPGADHPQDTHRAYRERLGNGNGFISKALKAGRGEYRSNPFSHNKQLAPADRAKLLADGPKPKQQKPQRTLAEQKAFMYTKKLRNAGRDAVSVEQLNAMARLAVQGATLKTVARTLNLNPVEIERLHSYRYVPFIQKPKIHFVPAVKINLRLVPEEAA